MLSIFILVVSTIALVYFLIQLVKAKRQGRLLQTLRDLLIIFLAIVMTAAIFYIAYRVFRVFL
ncbi:MAG: hypothetical protein NT01SARS_0380 [SAR86 cluster bacterium SAR86A]|jgi:hypothetical protein|uniref:Uncharacterized protein n=1 Tax=SAR86 cluster bacterium SAR86A TaxID=1123866 RepID=J5KEK5_9GAMM|nr:MAG: hypothetical protein NT01SARS_0380 [SAR86 cluster bacterium SAR86A]